MDGWNTIASCWEGLTTFSSQFAVSCRAFFVNADGKFVSNVTLKIASFGTRLSLQPIVLPTGIRPSFLQAGLAPCDGSWSFCRYRCQLGWAGSVPQLYHQLRAADLAAGQVDNAGAQNLQQMVAQRITSYKTRFKETAAIQSRNFRPHCSHSTIHDGH